MNDSSMDQPNFSQPILNPIIILSSQEPTSYHLDDTIRFLPWKNNTAIITIFVLKYITMLSTMYPPISKDERSTNFSSNSRIGRRGFGSVSAANRRTLVKCAYDRADTEEGNWRSILNNPFERADIDNFVSSIDVGPTTVTTASLEANGNQYFPWLYQILQRLGNGS
jgi:hypothetical protein